MNRLVLRLARTTALSRPRLSVSAAASLSGWLRTSRTCAGFRSIHNRLEPPYNVDEGMGDFMSPSALRMIVKDYQQGLLDRLNEEVKGTPLQNKTVTETVIEAAKDPDLVLPFNYASEALNNSFFIRCLLPPEPGQSNHEGAISDILRQRVRFDFDSLEQLKSVFSASVMGMFGNGWVWLVCDELGHLAVVPTFGSGTLLIRGVGRYLSPPLAVGEELPVERAARNAAAAAAARGAATPSSPRSGVQRSPSSLHPSTPSRSMSTENSVALAANSLSTGGVLQAQESLDLLQNRRIMQVGDKLFPLLCVSVHEHAWVGGYGVWGKEEYIKRFWDVVNWAEVSRLFGDYQRYPSESHSPGSYRPESHPPNRLD